MDRDAVIKNVIALNNPNSKTNNCGIWIPGQGPWCADPGSFSQYTYDATKVPDILTGDGYKMNNDTGIFEKNGQPLVITISTTAGNVRRGDDRLAATAEGARCRYQPAKQDLRAHRPILERRSQG